MGTQDFKINKYDDDEQKKRGSRTRERERENTELDKKRSIRVEKIDCSGVGWQAVYVHLKY